MEMFWDDDEPSRPEISRDERIAAGLELPSDGDDSDASDIQEPAYYNPQTQETGAGKKRRPRVEGGVAPTAKPVTADYDSDDARIIELKQLGYSDDVVAAKLIEEGRIRYVGKTIGSRYLRLRKVLDDKEDEKLDDELSDWHEGEDEKLVKIVEAMDKKVARQIERINERKWKETAAFFASQLGGKRKYTAKACRERCEAIKAGVELPPIELDPDQVGRRKLREERIKTAKAARLAIENEAVELDARKKAKTAERKRALAEANQKKVQFQLKRIAEKKERLRIRDERIANRERATRIRLRILNHMRVERDWALEKNRREKQLYKKIMGVDISGTSRSGKKNAYDSDEESEAIDDLESDEEEANLTDAEEVDEMDDADDGSEQDSHETNNEATVDSVVGSPGPVPAAIKLPKVLTPKKVPPKHAPAVTDGGNATVTEDTLFSPRSIMTRGELDIVCFTRGIPRLPASEESHPELVARMNAIDCALSRQDLDDLLRQATEGVQGNKLAKVERLQKAEASKSIAGGMGLDAYDLDHMRRYEGFTGEFKHLLDDAERSASHRQPDQGSNASVSVPKFADW